MIGQRRLYSGLLVREIMTRGGNDAHGPATRISGPQDYRGKNAIGLHCATRFSYLHLGKSENLEKGGLSHEGVIGDKKRGRTVLVRDM